MKVQMKKWAAAALCALAIGGTLLNCRQPKTDEGNAFSEPTGPYTTGTMLLEFKTAITDSGAASHPRSIPVQLWYPTDENSGTMAKYVLDTLLTEAMAKTGYLNLNRQILKGWEKLFTSARLQAVPSSSKKFPLVIFSPGFGMSRINYTAIVQEIASHGFVVASIDHPGSGFTILKDGTLVGLVQNPEGPDGHIVRMCQDVRFVVDSLSKSAAVGGIIDLTHVAMIGHSLGGAAALNVGAFDDRFSVAIDLDGHPFDEVIKKGIRIPYLVLLQRPGGPINVPDSMRRERRDMWKQIQDKSNADGLIYSVDGTMHFDFSDLPLIVPDSLRRKNGGVLPPSILNRVTAKAIMIVLNKYMYANANGDVRSELDKIIELRAEVL